MRRAPAAAWLGMAAMVHANTPALPEYALKAQIMVELMSYVQWPAEADRADRPFQIAVVGKSPFGTHLDAYAEPRTIHHRPIRLRYVFRVAEAEGSEAVFICRSEIGQAEAILAWARPRHVLTLSDDEELARRGAMVNLLMEGRFVRLAVNQGAATSAGLFLGSQLLRNARLITSKRPAP